MAVPGNNPCHIPQSGGGELPESERTMEPYEDDAIVVVYDKWTGTETVYDAECANANGIVGETFYPDLEVQINGTLPHVTCAACGGDLTEELE